MLLAPPKEQNFEPISRAYERAETVDVVGASCASSIRTHPVVQKEQGVSAYGQTWWVLVLRHTLREGKREVMAKGKKKIFLAESGFPRAEIPDMY